MTLRRRYGIGSVQSEAIRGRPLPLLAHSRLLIAETADRTGRTQCVTFKL